MKNTDKMSDSEMRQELTQVRKIDQAVQDCLHVRRMSVRLSPDGTYKPEGCVKMTKPQFIEWMAK